MDLSFDDDLAEFRAGVRAFLGENLPADWAGLGALSADERADFLPRWRETLREHRYLGLSWPASYGGAGLSAVEQHVVQEEFTRYGAPLLPLPSDLFNLALLGPTLLVCGTEGQKQHFIPRMLRGEYRFAQGFSEPDAGSDLFSLRTRAVLSEGEWVINGQKVWQTDADAANWLFVLARTEPGAPRAKGISMLLVPIDQPGVLVRPIRSMTGENEFCEVFLDDARTAEAHVVGGRGAGAAATMTLLGFERSAASGSLYTEYRIELERLVRLSRQNGREHDPAIRQRIGWCHTQVEAIKLLGLRALTRAQEGGAPGAESSLIKLHETVYHAAVTELAMDILGPAGLVRTGSPAVASLGPDPLGAPNTPAAWQHVYMTARAATIYGGSSQIQRNTLGERVLGLPRDARPQAAIRREG
jgi:alkylation response protein AidB-like acyl-CoA dehydrogenase